MYLLSEVEFFIADEFGLQGGESTCEDLAQKQFTISSSYPRSQLHQHHMLHTGTYVHFNNSGYHIV